MMKSRFDYLKEMNIDTRWLSKPASNSSASQLEKNSLASLQNQVSKCNKCMLASTRDKIVFGSGNLESKLMIIGEAPGKDEDLMGEPFVGRAGKLLDEILFSMDLTRDDVYITNTVKCRPPQNRNPLLEEIESCSDYLNQQIQNINPSVIILLGKVAANRMLGTEDSMSELRQRIFTHQSTKTPMIIFYHPAYLLRSPSQKKQMWDDIKFTLKYFKENDCKIN